jgi:branched-subunit amino acid aminotransferase/4-amino-4-deoxychorismate lyase
VVAPAEVSAANWLVALSDREPLALDPSGSSGWFEGAAVIAVDPVASGEIDGCGGDSLSAVGAILQEAIDAEEPRLAAALIPYSGDSHFAVFGGGLVRDSDGWRAWGTLLPDSLPAPNQGGPIEAAPLVFDVHSDMDSAGFSAGVEAVREAIRRGDVYVLNLTRRLSARSRLGPAELFRALVAGTPASMAAAWLTDDTWLVSASPERFVRLRDREVRIEPVKGTRPRGADPAADALLRAELAASDKERAEHVMIVDLERNDLGRVCVAGSVRVEPLCSVESTAYCHQSVSRVSGLLRPDCGIAEVLSATFPSGSVTGAPKIAAMRIIESLEKSPRGAYTGSLLVAVPGSLDSSVLIRTLEGQGRNVWYGTGCGITVDSEPVAEWAESVLKTSPLLGPMPPEALRETCRVAAGAVPLWSYHRQRLRRGGCGESLLARIDRAVAAEAATWAPGRGDGGRLTVVVTPEGAIEVEVSSRRSTLEVVGGPVAIRVEIDADMPAHGGRAKPADRSWWDEAHHRAQAAGGHQAILVDADGLVLDGSTAAVWIAEGGVLFTPPSPPAISSVSRAFVHDAAAKAGIELRTEPVTWKRFESADEAFLTNALGGCVAVRGRGGALSRVVADWFQDEWRRAGSAR